MDRKVLEDIVEKHRGCFREDARKHGVTNPRLVIADNIYVVYDTKVDVCGLFTMYETSATIDEIINRKDVHVFSRSSDYFTIDTTENAIYI